MLIFPPFDDPQLYERFESAFDGKQGKSFCEIKFDKPVYEGRFGYVAGERAFIFPDLGDARGGEAIILLIEGEAPRVMYPVDEKQFEDQSKDPNAKVISIRRRKP